MHKDVYEFLKEILIKKMAKTIYGIKKPSCKHCDLFNFYKCECSLIGTNLENTCKNLK